LAYSTTILNQLLNLLRGHDFEKAVSSVSGDRYVKHFGAWQQLIVLLYAQASGKDSLRAIQGGLCAHPEQLYHLGLAKPIAKSTLADANARRPSSIFESLFYSLFERCVALSPKHRFHFKNKLYSIDATVIELCLSLFPWAKFTTLKGALKLHCVLDHDGNIPAFVVITDAKCHELNAAKVALPIQPDSIYCFDRGYNDFGWFRHIHDSGAFFVTRAKDNLKYAIAGQQLNGLPKGVLADQRITLLGVKAKELFPQELRLVHYHDEETGRFFEFLTNNFTLSPATIARIYKARWQIEAFFKWIKQNLKIKSFLGTTKNAVMTQIWVAMCYYLLLAYIKFQTNYKASIFYLHVLVRETLLDRLLLVDLPHLNTQRLHRFRQENQQLALQF
jgi:hypothetical protein